MFLLLGFYFFFIFSFALSFCPLIHPNQTNDTLSRQNRGGVIPLLSTMQVLVISYRRFISLCPFELILGPFGLIQIIVDQLLSIVDLS